MHFVTFTVIDWVDVFTRSIYKNIITDSLNYCVDQKGLDIFARCLMSNHLHAVLQARPGHALSDIIRDYKKYTSKAIVESIQKENESRKEWMLHRFNWAAQHDTRITNYKFWQESNHAIIIYPFQTALLQQKVD